MKKAFTLAEVMIVLTVIGIISAIIMPIAIQNVPKKEIMMFKKGHNTLYQVISTLVNSDKYYKDGDLGLKPDGTPIDGSHSGDITYFCNSFADNVSTKKVNCSTNGRLYSDEARDSGTVEISTIAQNADATRIDIGCKWITSTIEESKRALDEICKFNEVITNEDKITTSDGISYYQASPAVPFGIYLSNNRNNNRGNYHTYDSEGGDPSLGTFRVSRAFQITTNGFVCTYKIFCMDVDEINKGEDPFGYGIRADGKIMNGKRATEWLDKGLNDE